MNKIEQTFWWYERSVSQRESALRRRCEGVFSKGWYGIACDKDDDAKKYQHYDERVKHHEKKLLELMRRTK